MSCIKIKSDTARIAVKNYVFTINIFLIVILAACNNNHVISDQSAGGWTIDTTKILTIPIDLDMSANLEVAQYFNYEGRTQLMIYNRPKNQLDWLDLEQKQVVKKISLPREGPHAIRKVYHFFFHNKDSIFLVSDQHLHLIDQEGNFAYSKLINNPNSEIDGIDFDRLFIRANRNRPLYFYNGYLYCSIGRVDYDRFTLPDHYQGTIAAKVDLKNWRMESLPIHYPLEFQEKFYGFLSDVNYTFLPGKIIYNFKHLPDVRIFDMESMEVTSIPLPSLFLNNDPQPYSGATGAGDELARHLMQQVEFLQFIYVPEENYYARFALIPSENNFGKSRRVAISFFDENFKVIQEFDLPKFHNYEGSGPLNGAVLVKYFRDELENELKFRELRLEHR